MYKRQSIGATDGISRRSPEGNEISKEEWMNVNTVEVVDDTDITSDMWMEVNRAALVCSRYRDQQPDQERTADLEDQAAWIKIFHKHEPDEDREWVQRLVEEVEDDMDRYFDPKQWPSQLETTGTIQGDALMVNRQAEQKSWRKRNQAGREH